MKFMPPRGSRNRCRIATEMHPKGVSVMKPKDVISRRLRALTGVVVVASLGGCTMTEPLPPAALPSAPAAEAVAPAATSASDTVARLFEEALNRAANTLFSQISTSANTEKPLLVIDPLIDGVSGMQTIATRAMESRISELVRGSYPHIDLQPFSAATVRR